MGLKDFKGLVADTLARELSGIRERFERVMGEDEGRYLDEVERRGARRARESAEETMAVVREAVGL